MKKTPSAIKQRVPVKAMAIPCIAIPAALSSDSIKSFDESLIGLLESKPREIAVDTSRLEQVNSSHVGLLWQTHCQCKEEGVKITLASPSPELIRVLKVLDLYDILAAGETRCVSTPELVRAARIELCNREEVYADEFWPNTKSVDSATNGFVRYLKRLHLSEITEFELRSVFYEVATNIQTHAQLEDDDHIVFTASVDDSGITLVFADSGSPFDPTGVVLNQDQRAAARKRQTRGFGISMIRKFTDRMSYVCHDGAINVLTLEKNWSY